MSKLSTIKRKLSSYVSSLSDLPVITELSVKFYHKVIPIKSSMFSKNPEIAEYSNPSQKVKMDIACPKNWGSIKIENSEEITINGQRFVPAPNELKR